MTHTALKLMVLTVVRTANIRFMRWDQIDLRASVWTLNESDTKSEQPFRVPLQPQAMMLLRGAEKWRDKSGFVFPVPRNKHGVLSNNAFLQYFNKHNIDTTGHGIRSTVTDFLLENDVADQDLADMALAHQTKKEVTAAYFRSDMLEKRRSVMQVWADYVAQDERVRQIAQEQDQALKRYVRTLEGMEPETLERVEVGLPAFDVDRWYRDETNLEDDYEKITTS